MASFERAMQIEPLDAEAMGGFLECCQEMGNIVPALDRLKKSLEMAPQNLDIREMLGQAYLAANDPEEAAKAFNGSCLDGRVALRRLFCRHPGVDRQRGLRSSCRAAWTRSSLS